MNMSWTEVQALGVKAASGAGVPPAQSLAFGAMMARHLADGGAEAPLARALDAPDRIVTLAHRIETIVENASIRARPIDVSEADAGTRSLLVSWLAGLPCQSDLTVTGADVRVALSLTAPSTRTRPERIALSDALKEQLEALAAKTYVPDSDASRAGGAGAGLMDLD